MSEFVAQKIFCAPECCAQYTAFKCSTLWKLVAGVNESPTAFIDRLKKKKKKRNKPTIGKTVGTANVSLLCACPF
jgi:hypothetical protein